MKLKKEVEIIEVKKHVNIIGDNRTEIVLNEAISNEEFEEIVNNFVDKKIKLTLETQEPILDEKERKYLSGVIRPFRDEIECIIKKKSIDYENKEYIIIHFKQLETAMFPYFKKGTMYKSIELNREYTLEELGL